MKKCISAISAMFILCLLIVCVTTAFAAASSPNDGHSDHDQWSIYYYGHVQCQPSYNEYGKHAAAAYLRYWRYNLLGDVVNDTGRLYTSYGYGQNDNHLYTRDYTYTDSIIPNLKKTQFRYGFVWVPHNGAWPQSVNPVTE